MYGGMPASYDAWKLSGPPEGHIIGECEDCGAELCAFEDSTCEETGEPHDTEPDEPCRCRGDCRC